MNVRICKDKQQEVYPYTWSMAFNHANSLLFVVTRDTNIYVIDWLSKEPKGGLILRNQMRTDNIDIDNNEDDNDNEAYLYRISLLTIFE